MTSVTEGSPEFEQGIRRAMEIVRTSGKPAILKAIRSRDAFPVGMRLDLNADGDEFFLILEFADGIDHQIPFVREPTKGEIH